jgi:hypothetical protein
MFDCEEEEEPQETEEVERSEETTGRWKGPSHREHCSVSRNHCWCEKEKGDVVRKRSACMDCAL